MKLNRRSVLFGLGTLSASVGGIFGSGAFSSVEATRTVEINTANDASAILTFEPNSPAGDNIIETESVNGSTLIKIKQSNLNEQATTRFEGALKVTNNGGSNVGLSVVSADTSYSNGASGLVGDGNVLDIEDSNGNSIVDSAVNLDSNSGNKDLTIAVNLQDNSGSAIGDIDAIVFKAAEDDYTA